MIKRIGIFITLVFTFICFSANAQQDTKQDESKSEGQIVMTKSELSHFLERIALAKKRKMQRDYKKVQKEKLEQLRLGYYGTACNNRNSKCERGGGNLTDEINRLNARIDYLMSANGVGSNKSTTLVAPHGNTTHPYVTNQAQQEDNQEQLIEDLKSQIDLLQQQLSQLTSQSNPSSNSEQIAKLNRILDNQKKQFVEMRNLTAEEKAAWKRYGNSKFQVFFANNVAEVSAQYKDEVKRAAEILKENPSLTIVLKGFASTVGNAEYNYQLSMRRNESVKRMLIDEFGVFPDQISSVFYGEDSSTSESVARRVDMNFIINK